MGFREMLQGVQVVDELVSVRHEMLERSMASDHRPLLLTNVKESPGHRAALNIIDRDRLCESFGVEPGELIDILAWAMDNPSEPVLVGAPEAPVLENAMEKVDLSTLPIPWHYPEDGGRYQSASVIIAQYGGTRNTSFHRQLLRDATHTVSRFVPRHLRTMTDNAIESGNEIPIAVVNGPDPVVLLAGAMSFDEPLDELRVASALHERFYDRPLSIVELSNGVVVPADSEYAMEARITLETDREGPYVDITGTIDEQRMEPVFRINSVHHRNNPIFHALIPAEAEHKALMGLPRAPTIKAAVSEVTHCHDVHMTEGGCGWLSAVVSITPNASDDGQKAILAALNGHRSMKMVTIVNHDIDVGNPVRVEWAMMTRWQPDRDTIILSGQKGSSLDPSRGEDGLTSKIGYDATLPPDTDLGPYTSVQ